MNQKRCPPPSHLERFLEEQLDAAEQRAVSLHVSDCPACQEVLERLTEETEGAGASVSSVRFQAVARPPSSAAAQPAFLSRLKEFPPSPSSSDEGSPPTPVNSPRPGEGSTGPEPPTVPGYEILRELGRGGMGVVYLARQVGLNRLVALKMILAGPYAADRDRARFRQEAEAVARLRHPNIIQIHDIGEAGGHPYFALEYAEEGSLAQRLRGDPQPVLPAARLIETLARAVHHAHQCGVVHRDLKPANILLAQNPKSEARNPKQIQKTKEEKTV